MNTWDLIVNLTPALWLPFAWYSSALKKHSIDISTLSPSTPTQWPTVSIVVAACNEEETIEVVHEYGHISHLAIVGHNPGLTGLINVLSKQFLENLPTCGIVRSTFAVDSWEEISPETIMSQYRYFPKIL